MRQDGGLGVAPGHLRPPRHALGGQPYHPTRVGTHRHRLEHQALAHRPPTRHSDAGWEVEGQHHRGPRRDRLVLRGCGGGAPYQAALGEADFVHGLAAALVAAPKGGGWGATWGKTAGHQSRVSSLTLMAAPWTRLEPWCQRCRANSGRLRSGGGRAPSCPIHTQLSLSCSAHGSAGTAPPSGSGRLDGGEGMGRHRPVPSSRQPWQPQARAPAVMVPREKRAPRWQQRSSRAGGAPEASRNTPRSCPSTWAARGG